MSRRKATAGYQLSSDDPGDELENQPPAKKSKPFKPPRLPASVASKKPEKKTPNFNFPTQSQKAVTPRSSLDTLARPKPLDSARMPSVGSSSLMPTPRKTPLAPNKHVASLSDDEASVSPLVTKGKGRAETPVDLDEEEQEEQEQEQEEDDKDEQAASPVRVRSGSGAGSSRQILEQRMDDMSNQLDNFKIQHDESQREARQQFTALTETQHETHRQLAVLNEGFASIHALLTAQAQGPPPSNPIKEEQTKPLESSAARRIPNPPLTPELEAIITKVVKEFQTRNGNRPTGDAERNTQMRHAREAFWGALQTRPECIRPPFVDVHGHNDYFPEDFADPKTGYRPPCPDWETGMNNQMEWVPTVLDRFEATIPPGNGPVSKALRKMSVEDVVTLIHDGPFRSGRAEWRKLKKTTETIEELRSKARQEKRIERKVTVRIQYRKEVPELTAPKFDWMFHSGMMSREVSDSEGGIVVERNSGRAQWVMGFYEGVDIAEQKVNRKSHRRTKRRIVSVGGFIPRLETGKGANTKVLRTAICGFSKTFRAANPQLFKKFANLVDGSVTTTPDILPFLRKFPKELEDEDEDTVKGDSEDAVEGDDEGAVEGDDEEAGGEDEYGGEGGGDGWDRDEDKELETGAETPATVGRGLPGLTPTQVDHTGGESNTEDDKEGSDHSVSWPKPTPKPAPVSKPPISPPSPNNLESPTNPPLAHRHIPNIHADDSTIDPRLRSPIRLPLDPAVQASNRSAAGAGMVYDVLGRPLGPPMAPPPELPSQVDSASDQGSESSAPEKEEKTYHKKGRPTTETQSESAQAKKRGPGRPLGSKNKPKVPVQDEPVVATQGEPIGESETAPAPAKKRGRPPGSKNKPKATQK